MATPKVTPLGENVLVQPLAQDKKTSTGIYLPDTASEEKPQEGKVVAVGTDDAIAVKKGQRVIYNRYSGTEVKIDDAEYLIVKAEDILAIIA